MDSFAQVIAAILIGGAICIAATGWAESKKCVISKSEVDASLASDIDYAKYDW